MKKVVINSCYGGFGLSHKATLRYAELKGIKLYSYVQAETGNTKYDFEHFIPYENRTREVLSVHYFTEPINEDGTYKEDTYWYKGRMNDDRDDPILIQVIEELGEEANGFCAELNIVEIPDDVDFVIEEYDGNEWVAENHRTWR